ncbi:MAG: nucleotidyltransferase family protein [Acidobacteriota bacterium]
MEPIVKDKLEAVKRACARYHVRRLDLFGSALRQGLDRVSSDIDFLVDFQDLSPAEHADAFFGLLEELERIFDRSVDLVEHRAIRNPYFLEAIESSRVRVYAAA